MKQLSILLLTLSFVFSCTQKPLEKTQETRNNIEVSIDLHTVQNDQVNVTVNPGSFSNESIRFMIPKTVPGTYSEDDYGRLIENLKAYDYQDQLLAVNLVDDNTWEITNAKDLDYITYQVNDSFDIEGELDIFSPAGTNILADNNFVLNLHGFVGYFSNLQETPYTLTIARPSSLYYSTSLPYISSTSAEGVSNDLFQASRYFQVIDNPIFYTTTKPEEFMVGDMKVVLDVHSPNKTYTAQQLLPNIKEMVEAQKNYLGEINDTKLYAIMLYLSDNDKGADAGGFGALEHHTSTVVILPETMPFESLNETMTDIVSHEFFHTLTPLNVHSEEIHHFDFNDPQMSQHLWMYEGVTEYFANHFQAHESLITPEKFYSRMQEKIGQAKRFGDVSFTEMSKLILTDEHKDSFYNVYLKGALIAMVLDIQLRELSDGEQGILHLMGQLSNLYGKEKPFIDDQLIPQIVELTDPSIGAFFTNHVQGNQPISYKDYFAKVGLEYAPLQAETSLFLHNMQLPFFDYNEESGQIYFSDESPTNSMLEKLGIQAGDVLQSVNGTEATLQTAQQWIGASFAYKEGQDITLVVNRDGKQVELYGKYETPMYESLELQEMDLPETDSRVQLRKSWLFN